MLVSPETSTPSDRAHSRGPRRGSRKYAWAKGAEATTTAALTTPCRKRIVQAVSKSSRSASAFWISALSTPNASHISMRPITSVAIASSPKSAGARMRATMATLAMPMSRMNQRSATAHAVPRMTDARSPVTRASPAAGTCGEWRRSMADVGVVGTVCLQPLLEHHHHPHQLPVVGRVLVHALRQELVDEFGTHDAAGAQR